MDKKSLYFVVALSADFVFCKKCPKGMEKDEMNCFCWCRDLSSAFACSFHKIHITAHSSALQQQWHEN